MTLTDEQRAEGWPERLRLRDTGLYDDMGGGGQRIYTTAGRGYERVEYVRADALASHEPASGETQAGIREKVTALILADYRQLLLDYDVPEEAIRGDVEFEDAARSLTDAILAIVATPVPASADPHDDPATRWESGPDGEWTIVPLWDGKPAWLRDDDLIRFQIGEGWLRAGEWYPLALVWADRPAFLLSRRPQAPALDEGLVALIKDALLACPYTATPRQEAEAAARALVAAGWRKEGA